MKRGDGILARLPQRGGDPLEAGRVCGLRRGASQRHELRARLAELTPRERLAGSRAGNVRSLEECELRHRADLETESSATGFSPVGSSAVEAERLGAGGPGGWAC